MNNMISIKVPILDAQDELGLDHDTDNPIFTRWATLAEKEIDSFYQYQKKRAVLPITGCVACLPTDAKYIQRAVLGNLGCDCEDLFDNICSQISLSTTILAASAATDTSNSFLIVDMGEGYTTVNGSIPHQIQGNKIVLNTNLDGQYLTIQYLAYMTDEEGFVKVSENHVRAISLFIQYMFWKRRKRKSPVEQGMMNHCFNEWHRECSNGRAKDQVLSESERQQIVYMLSDPLIGYGLELLN